MVEPSKQNPYEHWLARRREALPCDDLTDQIMSQVEELNCQSREVWWLSLVQQIERRRVARLVVCGGALAIGVLPFLFLTHVASF